MAAMAARGPKRAADPRLPTTPPFNSQFARKRDIGPLTTGPRLSGTQGARWNGQMAARDQKLELNSAASLILRPSRPSFFHVPPPESGINCSEEERDHDPDTHRIGTHRPCRICRRIGKRNAPHPTSLTQRSRHGPYSINPGRVNFSNQANLGRSLPILRATRFMGRKLPRDGPLGADAGSDCLLPLRTELRPLLGLAYCSRLAIFKME